MGIFGEFVKVFKPVPEEDEMNVPFPQSNRQAGSGSSAFDGSDKVVKIHTTTQLSVVVFRPERYEHAAEIADHLRERRTVVLNLEAIKVRPESQRLMAFLSGVVYTLDGKLKPITTSTYILTPYNVDIMGDDLFEELENNGMFI